MKGKDREAVNTGCFFKRVAVMGKREDGSREGKQDLSRKLSPLPFNKDM